MPLRGPQVSFLERVVFIQYPDEPEQNISWTEPTSEDARWIAEQINKAICTAVAVAQSHLFVVPDVPPNVTQPE